MKKWPWRKILLYVAVILVIVGAAPYTYLIFQGLTHNLQPVSMPISLSRGVYTSPLYTTDLDDEYQVDIYFLPPNLKVLDLDWKIVDDRGAVTQQGNLQDHGPFGNAINLARYPSKRGQRRRIILNIHQDALGPGALAKNPIGLYVALPERNLEMAYGAAVAILWAGAVAGPGALVLLILLVIRLLQSSGRRRA